MKAYELLEQEGLVTAEQGKGFYVNAQDSEMLIEQHLRKVEASLTIFSVSSSMPDSASAASRTSSMFSPFCLPSAYSSALPPGGLLPF